MPPETKFDIIISAFRQRIKDGEFGTAGRLPSLRMLAIQYGTTHETMNKVVQRLQAEGLLFSLGRAGVFVDLKQSTPIPGFTLRFDEQLRKKGLKPVEEDLEKPAIVDVSSEIAQAFNQLDRKVAVRRFRRQGVDYGTTTLPHRIAENFYPIELADGEILMQMQYDAHFDVLNAIREVHHKETRRVHDDVTARLPTPKEEEMLAITGNTPVINILRINYTEDEDGEVIMVSRTVSVASYFVLSYDYKPYWLKA